MRGEVPKLVVGIERAILISQAACSLENSLNAIIVTNSFRYVALNMVRMISSRVEGKTDSCAFIQAVDEGES